MTMLVLSRQPGEKVVIGDAITVTVLAISGKTVRIGIEAPDDVRILRAELGGWQNGSIDSDDHHISALEAILQLV
jgi:carbon storage regulator CsrA